MILFERDLWGMCLSAQVKSCQLQWIMTQIKATCFHRLVPIFLLHPAEHFRRHFGEHPHLDPPATWPMDSITERFILTLFLIWPFNCLKWRASLKLLTTCHCVRPRHLWCWARSSFKSFFDMNEEMPVLEWMTKSQVLWKLLTKWLKCCL